MVHSNDGIHFDPDVKVLLNSSWWRARMTHNLAIDGPYTHGTSRFFVLVGGQYNRDRVTPGERSNTGVWQAKLPVQALSPASSLMRRPGGGGFVTAAHRMFNGSHPGCLEARVGVNNGNLFPGRADHLRACEFDGRLSLVRHQQGGAWLLYARANPVAHGHRFVQVTRSDDAMKSWQPFQLIKIQGSKIK